jgi:predicted TIM-barrel fold metal-dependent hydrolase
MTKPLCTLNSIASSLNRNDLFEGVPMINRLLVVLHALSLLLLAPAATLAQRRASPQSTPQCGQITPAADHHQHLFSPAVPELVPSLKPIIAQEVIGLLDAAGIRRAAVLSFAYRYGRPGNEPKDEYAKVKAENDWAAAQAALFPKRLLAFCSFNPLKDYALEELGRCAGSPNLRHGIKLHFGNSDVQLENPGHLEKLKSIFRAANSRRMAIVVHMRASISKQRPYGPEQARAFLDQLLPLTPDVPVQMAHLAGSGPGYNDPQADSVLEVLAEAAAKNDPRTRKLWFDIATVAVPQNSPEASALLVKRIRQIGVKRILYGSDAATGPNLRPREGWEAVCRVGLSKKELKTIAGNVAPYLR